MAPPPSPWLPWRAGYDRRSARRDVLAGSTLAAYAVPSSIAYAQLAGLPVETGLYCYLCAGLAYALLGSSRQLAVGPTSSIALTLATTLGALAVASSARYAALAATTALLVGVVATFAWAMRWGGVVHFVSETVLTGFKIGAGTIIAVSQLAPLAGVTAGGEGLVGSLRHLAAGVAHAQPTALALGLASLALLLAGQWRWPRAPVALATIVLGIGLMHLWPARFAGVAVVGAIPAGLPAFSLPGLALEDLDTLLPLALACFLLGYAEASAAARLLAERHGERVDPNRELLAMGVANAAIAVGHGFPSAGGLSQSLVNDQAGARTPVAVVVCSAWMAVVLTSLTGLFRELPQPLLAALVLAAVAGMFDWKELRHLARVGPGELAIALVTIAAVLAFGILKGILIAATFSLAMLIRALAAPECVVLGRFPGSRGFAAIDRHPQAQPVPGWLVFRPNAAMLYFNADTVRDALLAQLARTTPPVTRVALDLSFTTDIDLSTTRVLADLAERLEAVGVRLYVAEGHHRVRALLASEGLGRHLGDLTRSYTVAEVMDLDAGRDAAPPAPAALR